MNKAKEVMAIATLTAVSLTAATTLESPTVEASNYEQIEQGYHEIPDSCPDYAGQSISVKTERTLRQLGFTGIKVNGKIDDKKEQEAFRGVQVFMGQLGVFDDSVPDCGYPGSHTLRAAEKMLNPSSINESQISQVRTSTRGNVSNTTESCDSIKLTKWVADNISGSDGDLKLDNGKEGQSVQEALIEQGVYVGIADGKVLTRTLGSFASFQRDKFGYVDCLLGSQTFSALNMKPEKKTVPATSRTNANSRNNINIDKIVVDKSDYTLKSYDNGVLVDTDRINRGDDRKYTYFKNGRKYTATATTRTGVSRVYRSEGPDYASQDLGGAPGSMGWAQFFDRGIAVHVGDTSRPSHACIRVEKSDMKELIDRGFGLGDLVIVQE